MIRSLKIKGTDHRDWLLHPRGVAALAKHRAEMTSRLATLIGTCQDSTDPAVLKALSKYEQMAALVDFLSPPQVADDE